MGDTYSENSGRLQDVLALIQALAVNERGYGQKSNSALQKAGLKPQSVNPQVDGWSKIARQHPEFFKLKNDSVSLVVRRFGNATKQKEPLSNDLIQLLMTTAIDLHDRQERRKESRRTFYYSLITGLVTVVAGGTRRAWNMAASFKLGHFLRTFTMETIHAIYEDGVFRPTVPVDLPDHTAVEFEPRVRSEDVKNEKPSQTVKAGLARVYAILGERYASGQADTAERHNEHQP